MRNPIIAALDVPDSDTALRLVEQLAPVVGAFKVGKELFVSAGPEMVRRIRSVGAAVFLDLKFHDIPNTVARAVEAAVRLDVQMLTLHASGGRTMMTAAASAAADESARLDRKAPLLLGVTVLTSLNSSDLSEVGMNPNIGSQVERLALLASESGLGGLVCSPLELVFLRQVVPRTIQLVTPGIRPAGLEQDDQKRTLSPREAMESGADWLVIGRPIYAAKDPRAAAEEILKSLPAEPE